MNAARLADALRAAASGTVEQDVALARFTTYRLGGPAAVYAEPASRDDVVALAQVLSSYDQDVPLLPIGRGSNLVVSDEGWPGLAIRLGPAFSFVAAADHGLSAGAATSLPLLANWAARRGLTGLEFLIAIPGSVGGAVRMNAGAHGREVADALVTAEVADVRSGTTQTIRAAALDLSYRHSNLSGHDLVLEASFALAGAPPDEVRGRMESYRRHRAETQPGAVQNAGSVFRNPPGDHAGRLVEATGLKGFRVGGARVSELHANFFIADDDARAQDVFDLVAEVRARVAEIHGIDLIPEIRFAGSFAAHPRVGSA